MKTLLEVKNLKTHFPIRTGILQKVTGHVHAVDGVSFTVREGETLGVVGESGCGKTTLGRTICKLLDPSEGELRFAGQDIITARGKELLALREEIQMIFQDPYASLNPRKSVTQILDEPLRIHTKLSTAERREKIKAMMLEVGLSEQHMERFPHQFSGGQRQRIGIARALMLHPKLVVCDEAVSALDVSVQSQILNLLQILKEKENLTYIFISHDLSVVRYITDRIVIMYLGKIIETATTEKFFAKPLHPYSQALLQSIPKPDPRQRHKMQPLEGDIPSPANPPKGCRFNTRCAQASNQCFKDEPKLRPLKGEDGRAVACFLVDEEFK